MTQVDVGRSDIGSSEPVDSANVDGRRARRDRNRDAVLDAMIELIEAGDGSPTVARISDRSGVSHRSVYRYFDDLNALFREAVERAFVRYADLSRIHGYGRGTFAERVDAIIDQRLGLFSAMAPLAAASRRHPDSASTAEEALITHLAPLRHQIEHHFDSELAHVDAATRAERLTTLELLLSFDGYSLLTRHGHDHDEIRKVYVEGLSVLLPHDAA